MKSKIKINWNRRTRRKQRKEIKKISASSALSCSKSVLAGYFRFVPSGLVNLLFLVFAITSISVRAQSTNLTALLQQGLLEEQANGNLNAAIADYRSLAEEFDKNRQIAATAVFRLGECYRAQNKTNEAVAQYQRILREFSDQQTLATLSRQNLTGLGATSTDIRPAPNGDAVLLAAVKDQPISEIEKILPTLMPDSVLQNLIGQEYSAKQKFEEVKINYGPESSIYKSQAATLEAIHTQIAEKIDGMIRAVKLRVEMTKSTPGETVAADDASSNEDREIQRIQQLTQNSPDLVNSGELNTAARKGELKVAAFLLDHGANVNGDNSGFVPLCEAADAGQKAMVDLLLSRGADVNQRDGSGGTALLKATARGYQAVVELLLAHKVDLEAHFTGMSSFTALHLAVKRSDTNLIKLFLNAGANVNAEDHDGRTPLSWAAAQGPSIVKMLLQAKADPNAGKGSSPLMMAIHSKDEASVEILLTDGANPNAISTGSWYSHQLNNGNVTWTPLFLAIDSEQLAMVKLLIKFKASLEPPPDWLPTDYLFKANPQPEILQALLDAGANVEARDRQGETVLMNAAQHSNSKKTFEVLLNHKADPNARDDQGETALQVLIRSGFKNDVETEELLRRFGAMDNPPNWDRIEVNRLSGMDPLVVFRKGSNDWNHFTLLETILNYYVSGNVYTTQVAPGAPAQIWDNQVPGSTPAPKERGNTMPFPDLRRIIIVRPNHGSTNETRIQINLLYTNSTSWSGGIDTNNDVPLEFGDMVEIPQYDHSLGASNARLTAKQTSEIINYLHGTAHLIAHDQKAELPLDPDGHASLIDAVLALPEARRILLASSDLSRVKVMRRDPKSGKEEQWIVDCSNFRQAPNPNFRRVFNPGHSSSHSIDDQLRLRDGDFIEVPEKP